MGLRAPSSLATSSENKSLDGLTTSILFDQTLLLEGQDATIRPVWNLGPSLCLGNVADSSLSLAWDRGGGFSKEPWRGWTSVCPLPCDLTAGHTVTV